MNLKQKSYFNNGTICNRIMGNKTCKFAFERVSSTTVENLLKGIKEKPPGADNFDAKLLKFVADVIAMPISYIINRSLEKGICPSSWKV